MSNDQPDTTAIVPTGLVDDQLLAVANAAERRIEAVNKIKSLSLRVTNHRDWTDQGGNPYLQVSGAEKVARLFGISWRLDEPTREDHDDGHFSYTFKGYFSMGTAEIEVVGTRSSKDPFFGGSKDRQIPPSEIDRNDVKKGAMTNCIGNGVTRLLGIRNLTWADLESAGIHQGQVGKVRYKDGDPNATPTLPNYGRNHCKGKPLDDQAVTLEDLQYYLSGAEKSLTDPEKAKWKTRNEQLCAAIRAEITRRAAQPAPSETPEDRPPLDESRPPEGAGPVLDAENVCEMFHACETSEEWVQLANDWQSETEQHTPNDRAKVKAAADAARIRLGMDKKGKR